MHQSKTVIFVIIGAGLLIFLAFFGYQKMVKKNMESKEKKILALKEEMEKKKNEHYASYEASTDSSYKSWQQSTMLNIKFSHVVKAMVVNTSTLKSENKITGEKNAFHFRWVFKTLKTIKGEDFPEYFAIYFPLTYDNNDQPRVVDNVAIKADNIKGYILRFAPYSNHNASGMLRPIPDFNATEISSLADKEDQMIMNGETPKPAFAANDLRLLDIRSNKYDY